MKFTPALRASAYHEAGHAVAAVFFSLPVYSATILPDKGDDVRHQNPMLGGVLEHVHNVTAKRRDLKERLAIVALAGPRAQKQHNVHGYRCYHGAADYDNATKLAMRVAQGSEGATLLLKYWQWSTDGLVRARWPEIAAVAAALLEHGTLKPMAIRQAIRNAS